MAEFYHSVTLNEEKCVGCTNCIKRCPTEAIRVRGGKAVIASERCIDCGECIRICPHHAKRARHSHLSQLSDFTYTIALPAPSLYGQFNNLDDIDYVLTGLKEMGFDDVFEVSRAAELVSEATRKLMDAGALKRPVISSACPAVVRLIRVRFPDLCDHVLPLKSPMETAAAMAKRDAVKKTGLPPEQIGCFFLTPCPAKVTDIEMPLGIEKSQVDGAIAISEVFPELSHKMDHLEKVEPLANSGVIGVGWSTSGGEAAALLKEMGVPCLIHQHRYSMLQQDNAALIPVIEEAGMGSIAFCPLSQGLLTNKYLNGIPADSRAAGKSVFLNENAITEDLVKKVSALNEVAAERGQSLAQMALVWALKVGRLTSVLLGASRISQVEENVKALSNMEFTGEELKRIDEILK